MARDRFSLGFRAVQKMRHSRAICALPPIVSGRCGKTGRVLAHQAALPRRAAARWLRTPSRSWRLLSCCLRDVTQSLSAMRMSLGTHARPTGKHRLFRAAQFLIPCSHGLFRTRHNADEAKVGWSLINRVRHGTAKGHSPDMQKQISRSRHGQARWLPGQQSNWSSFQVEGRQSPQGTKLSRQQKPTPYGRVSQQVSIAFTTPQGHECYSGHQRIDHASISAGHVIYQWQHCPHRF